MKYNNVDLCTIQQYSYYEVLVNNVYITLFDIPFDVVSFLTLTLL